MEPFNTVLFSVVRERIDGLTDEQKRTALMWLSGYRITAVVRALNYAEGIEQEVEETLLQGSSET